MAERSSTNNTECIAEISHSPFLRSSPAVVTTMLSQKDLRCESED